MGTLRKMMFAFVAAIVATGAAHSASTTDYSDQWWVASESGWGATVQQQGNVLFIHPLVYASDGKPVWFTAIAFQQASAPAGHTVFTGNLYAPTGPYYGGAFDPARVSWRNVGTLTFDATGPNAATITYTVDGVPVVKNVTRETWVNERLGGEYHAAWFMECEARSGGPFDWGESIMTVAEYADGTVTINLSCPMCWTFFGYEFRGRYRQAGRLGQITADLVPPDSGSLTISEIAKTAVGFTGRTTGTMTISGVTCSTVDGRLGAVIQ